MNSDERLERLNVIIDEISEMCTERVLLVEGAKDNMAVVLLGINAKVMNVHAEGGPLRAAEKLSGEKKEAVILTDWDPKGEKIASDLERCLSSLCVRYDTSLRAKLRSLCGSEIRDVESLPSFYCRLVTESVRRREGINK